MDDGWNEKRKTKSTRREKKSVVVGGKRDWRWDTQKIKIPDSLTKLRLVYPPISACSFSTMTTVVSRARWAWIFSVDTNWSARCHLKRGATAKGRIGSKSHSRSSILSTVSKFHVSSISSSCSVVCIVGKDWAGIVKHSLHFRSQSYVQIEIYWIHSIIYSFGKSNIEPCHSAAVATKKAKREGGAMVLQKINLWKIEATWTRTNEP